MKKNVKNLTWMISIFFLSLFMISCEKDEDDNPLQTGQIELKTAPDESGYIGFYLVAKKVTIDWGDGVIEDSFPEEEGKEFIHEYTNWNVKTIKISTEEMTLFQRFEKYEWEVPKESELRFGNCPALKEIRCLATGLTVLEIKKAESLTTLDCAVNQLTSLNLKVCPSLMYLYCMNNQLVSLDVNQCPALIDLWCFNNQLTQLKLTNNKALEMVICGTNKITDIDLSQHKSLFHLLCYPINTFYNNSGTYIFQSGKYMYRSSNYLNDLRSSSEDGGGISEITPYENKAKNPPLTRINLSGCSSLITFNCNNNQLSDVNIHDCTSLEYLSCNYNELSASTLNALLESLPQADAEGSEISFKGNPGSDDSDGTIATKKGWKIFK
jgi:hypothetical protein